MSKEDASFFIIIGTIILSIVLGAKFNGFIGWGFLGSVCLVAGTLKYLLSYLDKK